MSVKMRVGGVYRQRDGGVEEIVLVRARGYEYPWVGKSGYFYTEEGIYYNDHGDSEHDLIEEINPPCQPVELTDEEIEDHWWGELDNRSLSAIRRIIAAHEAKKNRGAA